MKSYFPLYAFSDYISLSNRVMHAIYWETTGPWKPVGGLYASPI